ncbi:MAG: peroxidase-related enzyme [Marinilabilia sp.]
MSRVKIVDYPESSGRLKEIYDDIISSRGKLADIHKAQSLRPESIVHHMDLYMEVMFSRSELSRAEREMMAVIVSITNGCRYCRLHHLEALRHYWRDNDKIDRFLDDYENAGLSERQLELCRFARHLTLHPGAHEENDYTTPLKKYDLTDAGLLDAILVVAYFNFVNRIVLGTGLEPDDEEIKGYKY